MALTSLALIVLCLQTPVHGWGIAADFAARIGLSVDQIRLISAREVSAAERTHSLVGLTDCSRNQRDTPRDPAPAPCADRR
jgi:hypothetical protein